MPLRNVPADAYKSLLNRLEVESGADTDCAFFRPLIWWFLIKRGKSEQR